MHRPDGAPPQDTLALLAQCSTSTIANVLLSHYGLRNTFLLGVSTVRRGLPRMVGAAYTLRFIPAREDIDTLDNYALNDNLHRRVFSSLEEVEQHLLEALVAFESSSERIRSIYTWPWIINSGSNAN